LQNTMIRAARRIVEKLRQHGHEAFFAGGWVRDSLLNRKPKDVDIATTALPEEVCQLFPNTTGIGILFGVVQVRMYGRAYEVATFRRDAVYYDGRHPSSVSFSGPRQDALRRDFTINGLFYDPETERIIDFVRGCSDIKDRRIRAIGDPRKRFKEDKLRMLRAIRFACNLDFKITTGTWKAITELSSLISEVSWERIRDELIEIISGTAPGLGLTLLHESGLLSHILPEVEDWHGKHSQTKPSIDLFAHTVKTLGMLHKPSAALAFGTLLHELAPSTSHPDTDSGSYGNSLRSGLAIVEKVCRRLRISRKETARVSNLIQSQSLFSEVKRMRQSALKRFLYQPHFDEHLELYRVRTASLGFPLNTFSYCREKLKEYIHEITINPLVKGDDLMDLGYRPGPIYKRILNSVEDLQLEGELKNRKEAIRYVLKTFPLKREKPMT